MNRNTELRKLPAGSLTHIAHILEVNKDWQKVVPLIPQNIEHQNEQFEHKYNLDTIDLMEKYARESKQTFGKVLFEEWGSSGKVRPTLGTLMEILEKAQIYRAVDEIAHMLGEPPPLRPDGPCAPITTSMTSLLNESSLTTICNCNQDHDLCTDICRSTIGLNNGTINPNNGTTKVCHPGSTTNKQNIPDLNKLLQGCKYYQRDETDHSDGNKVPNLDMILNSETTSACSASNNTINE